MSKTMSNEALEDFNRAYQQASPGEEILLEKPPDSVRVTIEITNQAELRQWPEDAFIERNETSVVIPLLPSKSRSRVNLHGEKSFSGKSDPVNIFSFPISPGFASTVNKAQGRTMKKVIIDVSNSIRPFMTMEMLYVMITRIKTGNDLRICPGTGLEQLRRLKISKKLIAFLSSFVMPAAGIQLGNWNTERARQLLNELN